MAVDKLVDSTQLDADLTSVANAIRTKGGTSAQIAFPAGFVSAVNAIPTGVTPTGTKQISITENGTVTEDVTNYADAEITVNVQGGGGETVESKDVDFIDYDGTIVASYTAQEFLTLTEMPGNPAHSGLTSQGWNWTLASAKAYVQNHGGLIIGQMYTVTNGKTKVFIHLEPGSLSPYCGFGLNGSAVIEWGDGTSDTVTGSNVIVPVHTKHDYQNAGDYVIEISVTGQARLVGDAAGSYLLWKNDASAPNSREYRLAVESVFVGDNIDLRGAYPLSGLPNLKTVVLPPRISSFGGQTVMDDLSLKAVVVPNQATSTASNFATSCYSMRMVSLPEGLTSLTANSFTNNSNLHRLYIPDTVTGEINVGAGCYSNRVVGISNLGTSIGGNCFMNNQNLQDAKLPPNLTDIKVNAFLNCRALTSIEIPANVANIAATSLSGLVSLNRLKFKGSTPPTVAASTAFASLPTSCKILVPTGSLTAYTSATNYPSAATYTYEEY